MAKIDQEIIERLDRIEAKLENQRDQFLTLEQTADYLNFSPSYLYKLTSQNILPFYRPNGKKIHFKRSELDAWLSANRVPSVDELEKQATERLNRARG